MPSSSLVLRSCATLLSISSFLSSASARDSYVYSLQKEYFGSTFFDGWDFFDQADPNKGFVTYVNESTAYTDNLIGFFNGNPLMRVDSSKSYDPNSPYYGNNGYGRPSVRITTKESFGEGLFIADIQHMPGGQCGTWPAFWTLGAAGNWPYSGEIDIVEGVNNRKQSLAALHTGGQCTISGDSRTMTGSLQSSNCQYDVATGANGAGCDILDTDSGSYGAGLNGNGGAVIAMEWQSTGIKIWSFPAGNVPTDIDAGTPDPSTWGLPAQFFDASSNCDIGSNFGPQKIVFNTNFCGDFGQAVWASEGCAAQTGYDSCVDYVAQNPSAFVDAYWQIGYVRYYHQSLATSTSSSSTITPSATANPVLGSSASTTTTVPDSVVVSSSTATAYVTVSGNLTLTTYSVIYYSSPSATVSAILASTSRAVGSPILASTTQASTSLSSLTSAVPQSSVLLAPMGSGVAVSGIVHAANWKSWPTATAPLMSSPTAANTWSQWPNSNGMTTTVKTTWLEPCETGFTTRTTYFITTHCGCTETPVPTIPMRVITTTCPESWGFPTPVVITIPAPPSMTPAPTSPVQEMWPAWDADSIIADIEAQTWPAWNPEDYESMAVETWSAWKPEATVPPLIVPSADASPSWNAWQPQDTIPPLIIPSTDSSPTWKAWKPEDTVPPLVIPSASATSAWNTWSASSKSTPTVISSSSSWSAWRVAVTTQVVVPVAPSPTWETYAAPPAVATTVPAVPSSSPSQGGWDAVGATPYVASYKGVAGRASVCWSMVGGVVLMVVALLL